MKYSLVALAPIFAGLSHAASSDDWASRSIYQVITDRYHRSSDSDAPCNITNYCGGTWNGITENLDYIQNMGFTAIQISPVNLNINSTTIYGQAFHGYWQTSLYDLNPNFGSGDDLKKLSSELHKRNMYLLVDVVASEMAVDIGNHNMTSSTKIDYSAFAPAPFNKESSYNPYCPIIDWQNVTEYQDCWLGYTGVATPDIRTDDKEVAAALGTWIKELVSNYSIDGIRVDGSKQITYDFFNDFVDAAGVYPLGEVEDGDPKFVCNYQKYTEGLENYPVYYTTVQAFTAGKMPGLISHVLPLTMMMRLSPQMQWLSLSLQMVSPNTTTDKNSISRVNTPLSTVKPSGKNNPSTTSTLYTLTATLNTIRNHAISINSNYVANSSILLHTDDSTYASRKGPNGVQIVSILSNQGSKGGKYTLAIDKAADPGTNLTEVVTCTSYVANNNGTIYVELNKGEPRVLFPTFQMNGTGICGFNKDASAGTGTATSTATGTGSAASATSSKKGAASGLKVSEWVFAGAGLLALALL
ncbi:hypothetical protein EYC80_009666 [Monilinia laxa]|uniref:alpha-amylase n=1 Tax=Monilinia laxa TaxID=61186 RepID=A0A5N6JYI6_MONLA|nr:hypothetical protein EYC80_009666 [Monilinia laxa]